MKKSKLLITIFFLLTIGIVGLIAGTGAGVLFVPKGNGLAGPAIALSYGLIGLLIALVVGGILAKVLPYEKLRVALYISTTAVIIGFGIIFYRLITVQKDEPDKQIEPERKVTQPVEVLN